jgi:RNA polymerase sigma factor (sigma-70 family)
MNNEELITKYTQTQNTQLKNELIEQLIHNNIGLIHQTIREFDVSNYEYDDILQHATIAVIDAVKTFDPYKLNKFTTLLKQHIKGKINRYFEHSQPLPSYLYQLKQRIHKLQNAPATRALIENHPNQAIILTQLILKDNLKTRSIERIVKTDFSSSRAHKQKAIIDSLKNKTIKDIIEDITNPVFQKYLNRIQSILCLDTSPSISLNSKINDEDSRELIDTVPDTSSPGIEANIIKREEAKAIKSLLRSELTAEEQDILKMLVYEEALAKIARKQNITKSKMSQKIDIIRQKLSSKLKLIIT